ncbi:MAG: D-TA family PLP-dependent enzyme, partial [bacterium]
IHSMIILGLVEDNRTQEPKRKWYELTSAEHILSPSVLVSPRRVGSNIDACIRTAGGADRLRPHVKTHKSSKVIEMHLARGITKFKCATLAEAEMVAAAGAEDILIAYQLSRPSADVLCALVERFPATRFASLIDNLSSLRVLEDACSRRGVSVSAYVDLDVGMHRTGIAPGPDADALYGAIHRSTSVGAVGLHLYDGQIHDSDPAARQKNAGVTRRLGFEMRDRLLASGVPVDELVVGGTPAFPCHAEAYEPGMTLSPGTYPYFDWGYATGYPDLPFDMAAVVFGRVISVPAMGRFTVDVGSKAIAADPEQPRGLLLNIPEAVAGPQSEEHWVFTTSGKNTPAVGDAVYVWPRHICPTIEHYDEVLVCSEQGEIQECWPVTARGRKLHGDKTGNA